MIYQKLYKRTATGSIQVWWGEVDDNRFRTHTGKKDGVITTSEWTVCTPKNVGRSNETTAEDQAHLEMEALYTKKQAQGGYSSDISEIDTPTYFKPMLARDIEKVKLTFPVASQPKLDGVRCIAMADGLWSRTGKPLLATPHISRALESFFKRNPEAILDGELYADKFADNFNAIISLVRKSKPTQADLDESEASIQYHVYDIAGTDMGFVERTFFLSSIMSGYWSKSEGPIRAVITSIGVMDRAELDELYSQYISAGYEGQMIRVEDGKYESGKRSKNLIKRKDFMTEEFEIVSINEGKGNRSGMAGNITYKLPDGRYFDSGLRGSWEAATALLLDADEYVGGVGTVRFFEYTPDGIPRFPVTIALYPDGRDL